MKSIGLVFMFMTLCFCGCALQRDVIDLNKQMAELERQNIRLATQWEQSTSKIQELGKVLGKNEIEERNQFADLQALIDGVREEIQILNGRLEVAEYFLRQNSLSFETSDKKKINMLDQLVNTSRLNKERILRIEKYLNFEMSESDGKKMKGSITESGRRGDKLLSENELYIFAKKAFDHGEYETAREEFQKLIKRYPKSKYADNAQFWIGEIYYREKWYEKAVLEYQKVVEKYPQGNKIQASLLKQGLAFYNLGDKVNARLILKELIKKFPKSNEAVIAKRKLKEF